MTAGASVNGLNGGGWTPLTYACYVGHDVIANYLMDECGADVNVRCADQSTALTLASSCGNESIVYFLLQVGVFHPPRACVSVLGSNPP